MTDLKTKSFLLTLAVTLVLCITALAQSDNPPAPEPLVLTDAQEEYPLGLHMEILEDPSGELTIDEVSSPEFDAQFVPSQVEAPNYGFSTSAYWVRFRLDNETRRTVDWLLEVDFANTHYVDLYAPLPNGEGFEVKQTGILRPIFTRDVLHPNIVFKLFVPTLSQQTTYLRFQNGASMTLPLTLWTKDAFLIDAERDHLLHGLFYGVLICLLIYNLFLLFSLRESSYLYFVIALAAMIFFFSSYDGYMEVYVLPNLYYLTQYYLVLSWSIIFVSIILFTDTFLEIKTQLPKLHRVNIALLGVWGVLILLSPFYSYHIMAALMISWALLSLIMVLGAGMVSFQRGFRPARLYLIAWSGLCVTLIIVILTRVGAIPVTFLSENLFRLGGIWLGVCWSFALADRINQLKAETESANRDLQASEARYRQLVETMNDGLGIIDGDGRYTYVNDRFADMLGYAADEMVGKLMMDFADADNQQILIDQLSKRKIGVTDPYEFTWRRKDGSELYAVVSPMLLDGDHEKFKGAFAVITDITEQVQAGRLLEQRVADRTQELSTLLELSHEITTSQGLDYLLNQILERLKTILDYRSSAIILFEEQHWRIIACWPASLEKLEDLLVSPEEMRTLAQAFESRKATYLNNTPHDEAQPVGLGTLANWLKQGFLADDCSWLGVPLIIKNHPIGLLILGIAGRDGFSDNQLKVAEMFANQAAIVIENNKLLDQLQTSAAAGERNRLAQDLHDSVTQTLFTASVIAQATPRIWDRDQGIARQNMEKLNLLIRGALAEMRSMLLELRSGGLQDQTLNQLLTTLAEAGRVRARAYISIKITGNRTLPENVTLTFYRIAQEALNNAINHARASQINIALLEESNYVELRIQDDGRGFDPQVIQEGHLGISIMSERAAQIGADLRVQSQPGKGTEIILIWSNKEEVVENDRFKTD